MEWFKTLPLYFETDAFRAVHACWDFGNIGFLRDNLENDRLTDKLIYDSVKQDTELHRVIEETLKGKEMAMPEGYSFYDKDGTERTEIRIKWWEDPSCPDASPFFSFSILWISHRTQLRYFRVSFGMRWIQKIA